MPQENGAGAPVLSVAELARNVRELLERRYPLLWVAGEISNLRPASSGHLYFVLKDAQAQVDCVMFRARAAHLDWEPREGLRVEAGHPVAGQVLEPVSHASDVGGEVGTTVAVLARQQL